MTIWRVPYPRFGDGPALERIGVIAEQLGLNLSQFGASAGAIVGSNGKGSTAAMAAALLSQVEPNVGLFTSPHLLALNERFRIGGDDIGDAELDHHWRRVRGAIAACGAESAVGGFEFLFLIAADWFKARGCAYTIWEAGLGGRLDPVRQIEARHTVLTALDLEHTALLGDTLEAIALEKIAAVNNGNALAISDVIAGYGEPSRAIKAWCGAHGVSLDIVEPLPEAPLAGEHQRSNAALALWLARSIDPRGASYAAAGFAATRWPGRLEVLGENPLEVIDVGHTPQAVRAALAGFDAMRGGGPATLVCGVSHDKDIGAIVNALAPHFEMIIAAAAHHKGAAAASVAAHAQNANPKATIAVAENIIDARRLALARNPHGAIYVSGGLFLAAEYKAAFLGRDPASLVFF